jgi:parallel beta-helix repeat protein
LTGTPPLNAVYLSPGDIEQDEIMTGSTVIFRNVTLTIRSNERIPIDFLRFSVYNSVNDQEIGYTEFEINGNKIIDSPTNSFSILRKTQIPSSWYGYGYNWGYDENIGRGYDFGYGYGYGYGNPSFTDITIIYDITFLTNIPGTFYAIFAANCTTHEFSSDSSTNFMVISQYPPIPQKENILPKSLSAITDNVNFTYDFIDLEDDLHHLNMQISGPTPYNTPDNYITMTFAVNENNPWDGWTTDQIIIAQDMGLTPVYNASNEKWTIQINTREIWNNPNPWNQSINQSVWPPGGYTFSIEVVDENGNTWGSISDMLQYSTFFYSFHIIQPSINQAKPGDTIHILNGTYNDSIYIDKLLHLIGFGSSIFQPDGLPQSGVYDINLQSGSSGTTIENIIFDFNGINDSRSGMGMLIGQPGVITTDITIKNNIFYPGDRTGVGGTAIQTSMNCDVSGLSIRYNTIIGNDTCNGNGILINPFYGTDKIEIYKNKIQGNISFGISIESSKVHVSNNLINNSGNNGISGIRFIDSIGGMSYNEVSIVSNDISHFENGIVIGNPTNTGSSMTASISSNTISNNNIGILVRFGAVLQNSVHFNNIVNNLNFGLNNIGSSQVNATYNWWGHPTGPYHITNPGGLGNPVSNNVLFSNWLTMIWNNTIWVDDNYDSSTPGWGIDHFNTISSGISAVFDGGFIYLNPGTYDELVFINKPLTLQAKYNFTNSTIITDENSLFNEFNVVNGQTIQIASYDVAINGLMIKRVNDVSFYPGAAIGNKGYPDLYDIKIANCSIRSIYEGIYLNQVENVIIQYNDNISGDNVGIFLDSVNESLIHQNNLGKIDTRGLKGSQCYDILIINNSISHKLIDGINLDQCENVLINHCQIENNSVGIAIIDSLGVQIKDLVVSMNQNGISLYGSSIVSISNNSYKGNMWNFTHAANIEDYLYFGTVQNAILNAGIGNQIYLYHGIYNENVIIDKRVVLKGYDPVEDVIIDGGSLGPAIYVGLHNNVRHLNIIGVTLQSRTHSLQTGKYRDVNGLSIDNCFIETNGDDYAVYIDPNQFSDFPPLRNGTNPFSNPVELTDNHIRGGIFYQYIPFELYGVNINTQLYLEGNDIDVIRLNGSIAVKIKGNKFWSLQVSNSYDISIRDNHIENIPGTLKNGINLWSIENESQINKVMIFNNSIIGYSESDNSPGISGAGILVAGGMDITIDDNDIYANSKGIYVSEDCINEYNQHCSGNITDLSINYNDIEIGQTAIMLMKNVSDVQIEHNNLSNNGQGIWLRQAISNTIYRNHIVDHYYGIRIDSNSSYNLIYDNYFMNNDVHAQDPFSLNRWNISLTLGENIIGGTRIGGNYWDTYEGIDTDGDYIGDTLTPFTDKNNIENGGDYLPLMIFDNIPPMITVLYPNGGEVLNTTVTILWSASDNHSEISNVSIYYSDDGRISWNLISNQEENDGEYLWDISSLTPGQEYSIRIDVQDLAGNLNSDTSDGLFGIDEPIYPGIHVEILYPIKGWVYFFNNPTMRLFPNQVIIMGHITIEAEVESQIELTKIEFYIDEQLMKTFAPSETNKYEWKWDERSLLFHTIKIKAYDVFGHTQLRSINVLIFNFDIVP